MIRISNINVTCGGAMISRKWHAMLVAAAASAMAMMASAQAARNAPPVDSFAMYPTQDPAQLRMITIMQQGLNSSSLNLTTAQKAEINKIVDVFVAELIVLNKEHPVEPGKPATPAAIQTRQSAVGKLNTALGKVMNQEQRRTWESAQAARRSKLESALSRPPPGFRGK